jgi:hypothetical protein
VFNRDTIRPVVMGAGRVVVGLGDVEGVAGGVVCGGGRGAGWNVVLGAVGVRVAVDVVTVTDGGVSPRAALSDGTAP